MLFKKVVSLPEGNQLSMSSESEWWALVGGAACVLDVDTILGVVPWEDMAFAAPDAHQKSVPRERGSGDAEQEALRFRN